MEFLSDVQAAEFGRFAGELSRADLERFFYLDDADRDLIAVRRGDHNRLGFAVQLGTVRFLGAFLADSLDVPWGVVEYLAAQLEIADPFVVKRYTLRVSTVHEHAREIRVAYGYRDLDGPLAEELTLFVYSRAWTHGEGLTVLFEHATAWLRRERVLLPGVSVVARLVAGVRDQATVHLHDAVGAATGAVDPRLPVVLRGLLTTDQGERSSRLESLRAGPTRLSGPGLDKALKRVGAVRMLGAGAVDLSGLPAARVRTLARYGMGAKAQTLRRLAEPRRTATLVATVAALEADAIDDALDLFDIQESRHRLARGIFHGRRGQIYQRYREGQEDQLGALGLVLNAVVLWNTRYTDAAITALRDAGQESFETDINRLSPLGDAHINMLGRYAFTAPTPNELRPLRVEATDPGEN